MHGAGRVEHDLAMLAILFFPLGYPSKDKFHVAPVHDVVLVSSVADCTPDRLGDGVTPDACRALLTSGGGFVLRLRYDVRPCGGDKCTTATDIRYQIAGAPAQRLWDPSRETAEGTHSFVVDMAERKSVCVTINAVRLPENAISQTDTTCIHLTKPH